MAAAGVGRLTRPQLLQLLRHAGHTKGLSKATVGELRAMCKRNKLVGRGELLDLDDNVIRYVDNFYAIWLIQARRAAGAVQA